MSEQQANRVKIKRHRSPNYPAISLKKAVTLAVGLYEDYKRSDIPVALAHKRWGYKEHGSAGNQVVAALHAFGLIQTKGTGKDRKMAVSDAMYRIAGNANDQQELIQSAALKPSIHRELWNKYDGNLPPDDLLRHYLQFDREPAFNEDAVGSFIAQFRETIGFAKLQKGDIIGGGEDEPTVESGPPQGDQHEEKVQSPQIKVRRVKPKDGQQEAVFPLDEGEAVLQWPSHLSADSFEDFKNWVNLIVNKVKRSVDSGTSKPAAADDDNPIDC